jgi:2-polyprenyl-6-methoxyphenol hydroxylase-like FAD-dependent oxidoreductase
MRALIVGGGVAGPATAMALQCVGIDAIVLESRAEPSGEEGSYLTVAPNGLAALDAIGALPLARSTAFTSRRNVMVGATGRVLGTISLGEPLADGTVALTMKRSRLARLLAEEARERGIDVRYGTRVTAVSTDDQDAAVTLEDGTVLRGDLVIGADGVRSVVRTAIDPDAPAARYVGLANFGGITRQTSLARRLPAESWHFVFGRRAFFGAHPTPDGDVVWFVNVPREEVGREERATTSRTRWRAQLATLVADDAGPAHELVTTGELELAGDSTFDLPHLPTWSRGRLALVGDALHAPSPSSGQGASLALEDAVVVAAALRDARSPAEAFARFEAARRSRVERIVAVGARSSSAKIPGRVGRLAQEAVLRLVFRYAVTDRSQAWITGHRVDLGAPTGRH